MTRLYRCLRFGCIVYLLFAVLASVVTLTGKPYGSPAYTANAGYVWDDLGGVEVYGDPGLFLCQSSISPIPFLPYAFPSLVVDC